MIFDLITGSGVGGPTWTPAELFKNGEEGFWFDGSDPSTMFQDDAGTIPVTASGQPVGLWKNKVTVPGDQYNYFNLNTSQLPLFTANSGKPCLIFDGVDDRLYMEKIPYYERIWYNFSFGMGITLATPTLGMYLLYWDSTFSNSVAANDTLFTYIMGTQSYSTTPFISNIPNSIITRGTVDNTMTLNTTFNGEFIDSGAYASANYPAQMSNSILPNGYSSSSSKISQFVFVNRVITPEERDQLEAFIRSKQ